VEFFETINKRRSIRKYFPTPVPEEVVNKALDAALLAPNSSNMQPWEFYWVKDPQKKKQLVKLCFSQLAARTAAELIVVVARKDRWKRNQKLMLDDINKNSAMGTATKLKYYNIVVPLSYIQGWFSSLGIFKWIMMSIAGLFKVVPRGPFSNAELFNVLCKSTALACENFMLAITAQGFATCPMEGFDEKRVKKLLNLNRHCRVVMCISVGEEDPDGVFGERLRFDRNLFVHEV
jgi:nitroreductase